MTTLRSWIAFGYLIVFGGIVGMTVFLWLMRVASPARVSTYAYVNPMVAVVLGWMYAGEALTARTVAAAAIIIAGVILVISFRDRQPRVAASRNFSAEEAPGFDAAAQESDSVNALVPVACKGDETR